VEDLNITAAEAWEAENWVELRKIAIIRENKLNDNPNVVLQWRWGAEMPQPEQTIYKEGEHGFQALKKCEQFELDIIGYFFIFIIKLENINYLKIYLY
jgi:hypothetical protein